MPRDYDLGDTLAQVNAVRAAFGHQQLHDLPTSRTGDSTSCLFYRALSDVGCTGVGSSTISFKDERMARAVAEMWGVDYHGGTELVQPSQMSRVVNAFDGHKLRHYEESSY
jgi:hypothetical protein